MATTEKDIIKEYPKTKDFADLIVGLGNKLKVDPMYLARTMNAETGGTFSPSKRNTAGSGATGLIQFTKETARNLGTTTQALSKMSAREQMSFVERYFSSIGAGNLARLRNGSQHDVNMAIFYPRAIGKGFNFNIAEDIRRTQSRGAANRFMRQNKGIKKAGDYTMKLTPPLPRLKPSENKKAIKIIEKSKEKELSPEEENFLKDVERRDPESLMDFLKNLFISEAGASEMRPRIDPIKFKSETIKEKMKELIEKRSRDRSFSGEGDTSARVGRPTSAKLGKSRFGRIDPMSKEAGDTAQQTEELLGDTSDVAAPLKEYRGDKVGTAPELRVSEIDDLEATQNLFEPEKLMLLEAMPKDIKRPAASSPDLSRNRELQERSQMTTPRPTDDDPEFPEEDNTTPNYAIVDGTPILDPDDEEENNLTRARFAREEMNIGFDDPTPMGEADPRDEDDDVTGDPIDFDFLKSLFTTGVGTGRDSESEVNIGADYFFDEPMPMGGEADPRDEDDDVIMNFEEGGEVKADFDGKDDEDEDEGDPPPLAKPEEVADDIPALLSEGEYVLPANVVRYIGLERIIDMHRQVLAEIQQMEDLGMIQNVDKNGEPEDDDDEMKFAEGEEGVTKGTIIIASSKPKGMMCPEPLMMNGGGSAGGDDSAAGDEASGAADADAAAADAAAAAADASGIGADTAEQSGRNAPAGPGELGFEGRQEKGGLTGTETAGMPDTEKAAFGLDETATELDVAFAKSKKGLIDRGLYGLGKLGERMGIDVTEKAAAGREASEKDASQPGDSDFEIKEENIKQDKVDDVISDLITKNVYIEGVGYVPLASLMSPRNDVTV